MSEPKSGLDPLSKEGRAQSGGGGDKLSRAGPILILGSRELNPVLSLKSRKCRSTGFGCRI